MNSGATKNFVKLLGERSQIGKVKFVAQKLSFSFARDVEGNILECFLRIDPLIESAY